MADKAEDSSISELRAAVAELTNAVSFVKDQLSRWQLPQASISLPQESAHWNFTTFEKYINQRFGDLSLQLRERYEAQQTGVTAALAAAEKAVNAALIAAEKAVDKAERAQELRNQVANEFRESLSDLSGLMWTTKEGTATIESLRRELSASIETVDKKLASLAAARTEAMETMRKALDSRLAPLEIGYANLQGRIWAVSALFSIVALAVSVGVKFIH
jgi:septal ring factor EnvC (AmiA/AmiB activator)